MVYTIYEWLIGFFFLFLIFNHSTFLVELVLNCCAF